MILVDKHRRSKPVKDNVMVDDWRFLFATAIVNPNGPTFSKYYISNHRLGSFFLIMQVVIHPLGQEVNEVGYFIFDEEKDPESEFRNIFNVYSNILENSMPTLFLKAIDFPAEWFKRFVFSWMEHSKESQKTYKNIKSWPGNPIKRVFVEIEDARNEMIQHLKNKGGGLQNKSENSPGECGIKDPKEKENFFQLLTDSFNIEKEAEALIFAYQGSVTRVIPPAMTKITFDQFTYLLAETLLNCGFDPEKIFRHE